MLCPLQVLEIAVRDSRITGRAGVGTVRIPLQRVPLGAQQNVWLPVQAPAAALKVCLLLNSTC